MDILAVLSKEEYYKHKEQFLKQYEASLANSFHCKTPNCIGFCPAEKIKRYEERTLPKDRVIFLSLIERRNKNARIFECPVCDEMSCVDCNIIHKNQTCYTYKLELERLSANAGNESKELEALEVKSFNILCFKK